MDDIKKKLLSVLLSKAGGVPLKNIESDYRRLVSEPLEWRNFNFKSLGQFLEAMPDAVRLAIKNGEIYVYGIPGDIFVNPTARKAQYKAPTSEPAQNYSSDSSPDMIVYIGNLPSNATKEDLRSFLSAYPLQCIRVTNRGAISCAFVETSRTVGERMCIELNRRKYGERLLRVEASKGQKKHRPKNSNGLSKEKSSTDSDADSQATGTTENTDAFSAGVPVAGRETSNGFRKLNPLSVDVETAKPMSYPVNDFGGRSRASDLPCVSAQTQPRPLDLYLPHTVSAQIGDLLSEKESEGERSKLIWDSDDELPPLVDSRLEEYKIGSVLKYSDRKENPKPSNVNSKASEPVEKLSGANGHCDLQPSGFHSDFGSSAKPAANNHLSKFTSESCHRVKKRHDGFNLYVKNIPPGVTVAELHNLFRNCMKIVPLTENLNNCFVIYDTMEEVVTAKEQIWTIRGSLLVVDIATRHKTAGPSHQADQNNSNFHPEFKNITCTIDSDLKRKVCLSDRKCSDKETLMPNISAERTDDRRRQFSNYSAPSSMPGDLVAANHEGNFNSLSNNLARVDNGSSRKHEKCLPLMSMVGPPTSAAAQFMSEVASSSNDESSFRFPQMPGGSSRSLSCRGMSPQRGANGNMKMDSNFAESELTCQKMLTDARLEDVNSNRPDCSSNRLEPSPNSPSGNGLNSIPKEMRLKELLGLYKDTYPNGTLPDSMQLADVVEIIITVVVPESDNSFLWGQLASEPWKSELEQMFHLGAKIAEIERTLVRATADLRRGVAKYDDDWCRVWIKERGKSESVVFFVDYGNTETVPNESIFQLPDEFWGVRPAAVPFRILDNSKMNVMEYLNNMVTAKVKKGEQHSLILEIYNVCAKS